MPALFRITMNLLVILIPPLLLLHSQPREIGDWLTAALWLLGLVCMFGLWAGPGLMLWLGCSLAVTWRLVK